MYRKTHNTSLVFHVTEIDTFLPQLGPALTFVNFFQNSGIFGLILIWTSVLLCHNCIKKIT